MVSEQLCRTWDANAITLGNTPKLGRDGRVVPISVPENPNLPDDKKKYYVVWVGRAVGLFHNWGLACTMVCGFSGCAYKGIVGLENARTAWETGPTDRERRWTPPKPGPSRPTPNFPPLPRPSEDHEDDDYEFPDIDCPTRAPPIHVSICPEDYRQLSSDARAAGVRADYLSRSSLVHSTASPFTSASVLSTPSWMSSGTLSPRTVCTPDIVPALTGLSIGDRHKAADSALSGEHVGRRSSSVLTDSTSSPVVRAYTLTPTPVNRNPSGGPSGTRVLLDKNSAARRAKGEPVYVVIRGEHPGVYFEDNVALLAAGYNPAMKIVVFKSLKLACYYFVQQYMAGNVGVPVFVVPVDEAEDGTY